MSVIFSSVYFLGLLFWNSFCRYEGVGDNGMGMLYVDIPTGYSVSNMASLTGDDRIQRVEVNGRTLVFYFNQVTCFVISFIPEMELFLILRLMV